MSHTHAQLFVHLVWSTANGQPVITPDIEPRLYGDMIRSARACDCTVIACNGVADHVHVVLRFPPTQSIATIVGRLKGSSSHLMNHVVRPDASFKWQTGYGAFSIDARALSDVVAYVRNQKSHHASDRLIEDYERVEAPDAGV